MATIGFRRILYFRSFIFFCRSFLESIVSLTDLLSHLISVYSSFFQSSSDFETIDSRNDPQKKIRLILCLTEESLYI